MVVPESPRIGAGLAGSLAHHLDEAAGRQNADVAPGLGRLLEQAVQRAVAQDLVHRGNAEDGHHEEDGLVLARAVAAQELAELPGGAPGRQADGLAAFGLQRLVGKGGALVPAGVLAGTSLLLEGFLNACLSASPLLCLVRGFGLRRQGLCRIPGRRGLAGLAGHAGGPGGCVALPDAVAPLPHGAFPEGVAGGAEGGIGKLGESLLDGGHEEPLAGLFVDGSARPGYPAELRGRVVVAFGLDAVVAVDGAAEEDRPAALVEVRTHAFKVAQQALVEIDRDGDAALGHAVGHAAPAAEFGHRESADGAGKVGAPLAGVERADARVGEDEGRNLSAHGLDVAVAGKDAQLAHGLFGVLGLEGAVDLGEAQQLIRRGDADQAERLDEHAVVLLGIAVEEPGKLEAPHAWPRVHDLVAFGIQGKVVFLRLLLVQIEALQCAGAGIPRRRAALLSSAAFLLLRGAAAVRGA